MKKIFPALMLTMIVGLFSSCVIVTTEDPKYTVYFNNNSTTQYIYDWYLKDDDNHNHVISDSYCPVSQRSVSSMSGLPRDNYQVWFCVYSYSNPTRGDTNVYMHTENYVYVDKDTTFNLTSQSYTAGSPYRSAVTANNDEEISEFVLTDSNGNTYPLVKAE